MSEKKGTAPPPFAEVVAATNFSFLRGASHPKIMVQQRSEEHTSELQSH